MGSASTRTQPHDRVLVVEDDEHVREAVARALRFEGYDVTTAVDGNDALVRIDALEPDVIVLDVLMPGTDGLAVCRILRDRGNRTPILMLTARHEVSDRVAGLDAGADDYLVKPFALDELFARLRALLRRNNVTDTDTVLRVEDLVLDPERRQVWRGGRELLLTKTEFDLLELLMFNAGIVVTRETIYERIWGYEFETSSKSLDVSIGYLRRKTEADGEPRLIHTVRGGVDVVALERQRPHERVTHALVVFGDEHPSGRHVVAPTVVVSALVISASVDADRRELLHARSVGEHRKRKVRTVAGGAKELRERMPRCIRPRSRARAGERLVSSTARSSTVRP